MKCMILTKSLFELIIVEWKNALLKFLIVLFIYLFFFKAKDRPTVSMYKLLDQAELSIK